MSKRSTADTYNLPESSFRHYVTGHPARRDSKPTNCKLTDTEKSALVQWILSIDQRGLAPRAANVRQMANLLLVKRSAGAEHPTLTVGKCWVYSFVRRHEALQS